MDDESAAVVAAMSQAAGEAAAEGVRRAYGPAGEAGENPAVGEGEAGQKFRIGGVLSLVDGQMAAADGATGAIAAIARLLDPSEARFGSFGRRLRYDLTRSQAAAAAGSIAAMRCVCLMEAAARGAPQAALSGEIQVINIDPEMMIRAARVGARAGSLAVRLRVTSGQSASRCVALLVPLLGGSLPATVAVYNTLGSSHLRPADRGAVFGVLAVGVLAVCSGVVFGTLSSSRLSVWYCRFATAVAFGILGMLIIFALYTLAV